MDRQPQADRRRDHRPRRRTGRHPPPAGGARRRRPARKRSSKRARRRTPCSRTPSARRGRGSQEIAGLEQGLADKTRALADRLSAADTLEHDLRARDAAVAGAQKRADAAATRSEQIVADRQRELQRVAGLTADEARELLLKQIEADARRDAANLVKRLEAEARETAAARAQHIITDAIQRSAAETAIETTVSVVDLPSDDMKGRIIGREGRNIRALEQATGVELIVDDTPGAIILSSFDPFRREVARQAIERLIADGRIHPARIEEVVEKVKAEMEETVRKEGEAAAFELGLYDLHPEILRLMGRLKFRTSYGQNVLNHSLRSRVPRRHHGEGARARTATSPRAPRSCTTSARRSTATCRARTSSWASTSCASTARASRCSRRWRRITWTSTGRRSRR